MRAFIVKVLRRVALVILVGVIGIVIDVVCGSPWPIATFAGLGVTLAYVLPHDSGDTHI